MHPEAQEESLAAFEHLLGTYRRIAEFDEHGFAGIWLRIRRGPLAGMHWVAIEPELLRKPQRRRGRRQQES